MGVSQFMFAHDLMIDASSRYYAKVVSQTSKQLQRRGYKIEDMSG